jgi:hypothetical protein
MVCDGWHVGSNHPFGGSDAEEDDEADEDEDEAAAEEEYDEEEEEKGEASQGVAVVVWVVGSGVR